MHTYKHDAKEYVIVENYDTENYSIKKHIINDVVINTWLFCNILLLIAQEEV